MDKLPEIALLFEGQGEDPLVALNEGQDFEDLLNKWAEHDDAVSDGTISADHAQSLGEFLITHEVKLFEDTPVFSL